MPPVLANTAAFLVGLASMEGVAWAMHRYVMHGPLWVWHRSHHEPERRGLEENDLFAIVFAAIAIGMFWAGARPSLQPLWWLGAGVTGYGVLYALVHDGLVHRRFPFPVRADRGYLLRLVRAHHLHHMTHTREGAVSFGFLLAQDPDRLTARLTTLRTPRP
jgi:beta-carotene 3-hydroxylase